MIVQNRNYTIDLLRFVAAVWVALFHFNQPIPHIDNWYRNLVKMGFLGVPIFFVISGYCIMLTATRSKCAVDFLIKRLFRIFPAYWLSILIVLAVVIFQKVTTGFNSVTVLPKDFVGISAVLTLLTRPFSSIPTINWVYWSLTYELFFYFIITISLSFRKNLELPFLLFVSILALIIPSVPQGILFFLDNWPFFALGLGVYLFYNKQHSNQRSSGILLIAISIITLAKNFLWSSHIAYCAAGIMATLIIIVSHHIAIKKNILSKLGDYSYAVYLIHVPIGCYFLGAFKNQNIQNNIFLNMIFDFFTYVFISYLAHLIFKYIERPAIQLGRNISKKYFIQSYRNE